MIKQMGSFPHPVLGSGDDVASIFEVSSPEIWYEAEDFLIRFRIKTNDPTIRQMIQENSARMHAKLSCSSTLYATDLGVRKIKVHEDGYSYEASIDQQLIRGRVAIDINVVSLAHNANFQWEMQHSDYAGYEFDIQPGDILALGGVLEFDVEKDYDPMSPPLGSCFRIVRDQYGGRVVRVDFSDPDQVLIYVPEAIAQGLLNNSSYPDLQISSVVLPALMETIDKIWRNGQEVEEEDFSERGWFDSVKRKMDAVPDGGLFEVAQRMLDHPVERVITLSFLEEEGDD